MAETANIITSEKNIGTSINSQCGSSERNYFLTNVLQEGAILIFVPGMAQISDINKKLESDQMFRSGEKNTTLSCSETRRKKI